MNRMPYNQNLDSSEGRRWAGGRAVFAAACLLFAACSVETLGAEDVFSPSVGGRFYEIAYELGSPEGASEEEITQALMLLRATMSVDEGAKYALGTVIDFGVRYGDQNRQQLVASALVNYADENADLEVASKAVRYLINQLDSREQREQALGQIIQNVGTRNKWLDSELATLLGLLMAEKADTEAATNLLMRAYSYNKYNRLAFAKLSELLAGQIEPHIYLEQMRLALDENPYDLKAAMDFAGYAEQLQLNETAMGAYKYAGDLWAFLTPGRPLPDTIYLPWALCSYNTARNQDDSLQIAQNVRRAGVFNLFLEAIAGKAALKTGDADKSRQILADAERQALEIVNAGETGGRSAESRAYGQLAWFYSFAKAEAEKALDFANKAYAVEPNSPANEAMLAYALAINGQTEWVAKVVDANEQSQIGTMALAIADAAEGKKEEAKEKLRAAIAGNPGSLEAEKARQLLAEQGGDYVPAIAPDIILTALQGAIAGPVVPEFVSPEKRVSYRLNLRGSKFSYGSDFGGTLAITNMSSGPMLITENGMLEGNIRVDAVVKGDITAQIPNLVSMKVKPSRPVSAGQSLVVPLRLETGELLRILRTYPQGSLKIEFTAYLDPVRNREGGISNGLAAIAPAKASAERPGVELSDKYLRNRINSLRAGGEGQKIQVSELFSGLLAEEAAMANREPLYRFLYAEWMPQMLKSALVTNLTDAGWIVRVHTMADILQLRLDYELTEAVSENLGASHWPARMMAIYVLGNSQGADFKRVLDHTAAYDASEQVREMAIALGGARPEPQPKAGPAGAAEQTPGTQPGIGAESVPAVQGAEPAAGEEGRITEPQN